MTLAAPPGRDGYRSDLTRWNRAGLGRFRYVDGNAAVWLEELRLGMLVQYLRGIGIEDRLPEKWRDLFMRPPAEWRLEKDPADHAEYAEAVAWADLLPAPPSTTETAGTRNQRLAEQYGPKPSPNYAWETMRAFARAAHVLLGHLDAYANEGYLRTATQWENLRKLAATVNYQPRPPASATTDVALEVATGAGRIEVARGLAMKYAPPLGGAPLIFETLRPIVCHADLNAARASDWNRNPAPVDTRVPTAWIVPDKAALAQGDAAILSGPAGGRALTIAGIDRDAATGIATLSFTGETGSGPPAWQAELLVEPESIRVGLPESGGGQVVVKVAGAASIAADTIVEIRDGDGRLVGRAVAAGSRGDQLILSVDGALPVSGRIRVEAYTPFDGQNADEIETPLAVTRLYFKAAGGGPGGYVSHLRNETRRDTTTNAAIASVFRRPADGIGKGYANLATNPSYDGEVLAPPPASPASSGAAVRFDGKPPRDLEQGDWYAARRLASSTLTAHRVTAVRVQSDIHYVYFDPPPPHAPELTEFIGPMKRRLRPLGHDRNPEPAINGGACEIAGLASEARDLVKPGKAVIIVNDAVEPPLSAIATVAESTPAGPGRQRIVLVGDTDLGGWPKGSTRFHLNTVGISHGETRDPKVLGSGDAEKRRQDFRFKIDTVSFVPSTASATGVAPDMDVSVDGVTWEFRDITDPAVEETDAWSVVLNEDDTLQIHFRRRLPTGTNNIGVPRHRSGAGIAGTGVPAWSLTAPMKKNRFVTAIVQPFPTAGGADREPVGAIRENAPAHLAANGRAVSLADFERLCQRHASVWQARAREVVGPGATNRVEIIVVPAGGGAVPARLAADLTTFIASRALPGVVIDIAGYQAVPVSIVARARVDTARYDRSDVQDRLVAELAGTFGLARRGLSQPVYVAEILAAGERVDGVETIVVEAFATKPGAPRPLREATMGGALAAIFPKEDQVAYLASASDLSVTVEAAS